MKKNQTDITKWQKTGLILLIIGTLVFIKIAFFPGAEQPAQEPSVNEPTQPAQNEEPSEDIPRSYVSVYFIGQNANKDEVYKVVKRSYDAEKDGTKLNFSIKNLLKGPTPKEKAKGIYSEIPQGTKLISIEETANKIVINLSGDFEQGGGTDGLYKRLYQLIKTSNKNTALDVYLNIDGKQVNVVGGEGIMLNQPLKSTSLDE